MPQDLKGYPLGSDEDLLGKRVLKYCPNGHQYVIRKGANGELFLGCSEYPDCKETDELPVHLVLEIKGAKRLPGF